MVECIHLLLWLDRNSRGWRLFVAFRFCLTSHIENAVTELFLESVRYLLGLVFGCQVGIDLIQHLGVFMAGRNDNILPRYPPDDT